MGVGPIPWTAVQRYTEVEGYDPDDREMFITCVMSMDVEYLKIMNSDEKKGK